MEHPLKKKLADLGITQIDLALRIGRPHSYVCGLLNGYRKMPDDTERQIKRMIRTKVVAIAKNPQRFGG